MRTVSSRGKDTRWLLVWCTGTALLVLWDAVFLNQPAFLQLQTAFLNTLAASVCVVLFALLMGWAVGTGSYFLARAGNRGPHLLLTFFLNMIRSVPQIVGILIGYVILTLLIREELLQSRAYELLSMALVISVFVFLEVADLIRERIEYYQKLDFFQAMLCCGIRESRIVNIEILWKNSATHLLHKMISLFGVTIFLQCSIDFILSVGLSTDVSSSNFPTTLGSLLAKMDSKQDILAVGTLFANPGYVRALVTEHLQGISVACIIVFTLICIYQIANGFVRRHNL